MRYSSTTLSTYPLSSSTLDESVPRTIEELIENQGFPRSYLFRATPYDRDTGAEVEVRASLGIEIPILDSKHWPAILKTSLQYTVSLFSDDWETHQGRTSIGNIDISIGDGDYDYLLDYLWQGRYFEILLGAEHFTFDQYQIVASGTVAAIEYTTRVLTLKVQGKEYLLADQLFMNYYTGTGGLNGSEEITDVNKILAYGRIYNYSPILIDPNRLIYQLFDGKIARVGFDMPVTVYDGGATLTYYGYTISILTAGVPAGQYVVQTDDNGTYIRLGAPPVKDITVDFDGQSSRTDSTVALLTLPDILKDLLTQRTDLTIDDLDLGSFEYINNHPDLTETIGGLVLQEETAADVINYIMRSLYGSWTFTPEGKLKIALFEITDSVGTITSDSIVDTTFKRRPTTQHPYEWVIGYNRNWTVQTENDLVGSTDPSRRVRVSREYLSIKENINDFTVALKSLWPTSKKIRIDTCISTPGSANAAMRLLNRLRYLGSTLEPSLDEIFHLLHVYSFTTRNQQFKYSVGQTITIEYPRFDLSAGKTAIIMSISEDTNSGQTEFVCWACPKNILSQSPSVIVGDALIDTASGAYLIDTDSGAYLVDT